MLEVTVSADSELLYFFPTLGSTLFKILTTWTHPLKSCTSQPFSFSSLIASFLLLSQRHKNSDSSIGSSSSESEATAATLAQIFFCDILAFFFFLSAKAKCFC